MKKDGLSRLQGLVADTINTLVDRLIEKTGVERDDIVSLVAAGNTTMVHLFYGIDPRHIRAEPYIPTMNFIPTVGLDARPASPRRASTHQGARATWAATSPPAGAPASRGRRVTLSSTSAPTARWSSATTSGSSAAPVLPAPASKARERPRDAGGQRRDRDRPHQPDTLEPMLHDRAERPKGICGSG
jgi:hypothetical protein